MSSIIRDPVYAVGLVVLAAVVAMSVAFGGSSSGAGKPARVAAPPATATAVTAPTPTLGQALVDARRALDVEEDRAALEAYRQKFGSYPTSDGLVVEFCRYGFEPGCSLISISKDISGGDGSRAYWYRSDGVEFTLFAEADSPQASNSCPAELPPQFAGVPVLCAVSAKGTR